MPMNTFFPEARHRLSAYLADFFQRKQHQLAYLDPTSRDAYQRLVDFAVGGKMLRGAMSLMMYEMLSGKTSQSMVPMAAAIEMLGSVLLIHDDIIDRDRLRRGHASLYAQYEELGQKKKYADPAHFGISMGICVGDLGFFALQEMLGELPTQPERVLKLFQLIARESQVTGIAEMIDTERAMKATEVTATEIETLYIAKTARYTFCLPLLAGGVLAGASDKTQKTLDRLGEVMGLLFQIKDDELGLFGTAEQIGKSADSDVREGKRTLYYLHVMELATPAQRQKLSRIFGSAKVTPAQLRLVQELVESTGARAKVNDRLKELEEQASQAISLLDISETHRQTVQHFLDYNLLRKR
jgi:geranylgeranyl diphosphate synthase, type I